MYDNLMMQSKIIKIVQEYFLKYFSNEILHLNCKNKLVQIIAKLYTCMLLTVLDRLHEPERENDWNVKGL